MILLPDGKKDTWGKALPYVCPSLFGCSHERVRCLKVKLNAMEGETWPTASQDTVELLNY